MALTGRRDRQVTMHSRGTRAGPVEGMLANPRRMLASMRRNIQGLNPDDEAANMRVWQMYDELVDFRTELSDMYDSLGDFEDSTTDFLGSMGPLMRAPVPRVWDHVEGGTLAEPIRATLSHAHPNIVGGEMSWDAMREARDTYARRMENDVLQPLNTWLDALKTAEGRLPGLERLQSDLARQTRQVEREEETFDQEYGEGYRSERRTKMKARKPNPLLKALTCGAAGSGGAGGPKEDTGGYVGWYDEETAGEPHRHEARRIEDVARRDQDAMTEEARTRYAEEQRALAIARRQRELEASRASFLQAERLLYEQLSGLARDAAWLKSYLASALLLQKEAMQVAVVALGPTKQPLPSFGAGVAGRRVLKEHGIITDNVALAAEFPVDVTRMRRVAAAAPAPLLEREIRAHRATATPMELAAREEVSPTEPVPPVMKGATAVPAELLESRSPLRLENGAPTAMPAAAAAAPARMGEPVRRMEATPMPAAGQKLRAAEPAGAPLRDEELVSSRGLNSKTAAEPAGYSVDEPRTVVVNVNA